MNLKGASCDIPSEEHASGEFGRGRNTGQAPLLRLKCEGMKKGARAGPSERGPTPAVCTVHVGGEQ